MDTENTAGNILAIVRNMNRCWTEGWHEDAFRQYIHPDVVAIVPTTPGRLEGQDAYGAGWQGFSRQQSSTNGKNPFTRNRSMPGGNVLWPRISSPSRSLRVAGSRRCTAGICSSW